MKDINNVDLIVEMRIMNNMPPISKTGLIFIAYE